MNTARTLQRSAPAPGGARARAGFTLIELLIVLGIIAMIAAVSLPVVLRGFSKSGMRLAVGQVVDACVTARRTAVLTGTPTAVRIVPFERRFDVTSAGGMVGDAGQVGGHRPVPDGDEPPAPMTGGGAFSAQLPESVKIEFLGVNLVPDQQNDEEVYCVFYPNGTSDEMAILLHSDEGDLRKLLLDPVAGVIEVEIIR